MDVLGRLRGMGEMARMVRVFRVSRRYLVMQFWVQYRSDLAAMGSSESEESEFQLDEQGLDLDEI